VLNIDGVIGMHPLMTFAHELYSKEAYEKIPFVIERGSKNFKDLFPDLNNPHFEIDKEQKPIYHAKCVMASNFMMLMWNSYFDYLSKEIGMDKDSASLLLETTLTNAKLHGLEALTGPLIRRDFVTIKKNISSLSISGEDQLYREFIKTYFPELKGELCLQ
jgi:2-dehydropantoate 2-reductase